MFIAAWCGIAAWTAEVNMGWECGQLARGDAMRAGRPRSRSVVIAAVCAMRMTVSREHRLLEQGLGKPGFPTHLPAGGPGPHAGYGEIGFSHFATTPSRREREALLYEVLEIVA